MKAAMQKYHVGLIPDGNRRWARERGLEPWEGQRKGAEKEELFIEWCLDHEEIDEITTYGLSEENYRRSARELTELYNLFDDEFTKLLTKEKIHTHRVKINVICTNAKPLPKDLIKLFGRLREETKNYGDKVLNLLIGYTGQAELLEAIASPRNRLKNLFFGLTGEDLRHGLKVKRPCDFIIRTGEESEEREARSGFLLWQSAYAEYYHMSKYFPDVTKKDLNEAWAYFEHTGRKKGL
ncbi:polyprenyl diphosphate synthase [Chloroflexota bacterium]